MNFLNDGPNEAGSLFPRGKQSIDKIGTGNYCQILLKTDATHIKETI